MASWKQQALIEAPLENVWDLLADPSRYREWSDVDVTGVPTRVEKGSTFQQRMRGPLGIRSTTTFEVEELKELHEIKLRCQTSGYYSRWLLTEAQGNTFLDLELGVEGNGLKQRANAVTLTKGFLRRMADRSVDGLRRTLGG